MKFWWILFGFISNLQLALAQQSSYFNLGKDQFEGVQIYDVIQDNDLNYWFATDNGFYKYDCHTFKKIHCNEMKGSSAFGFVINKAGIIYCYNINNQILQIKNDTCSVFYELLKEERSNDIRLAISSEEHLVVITQTVLIFNADPNPHWGFSIGKKLKTKNTHSPLDFYSLPFHTKTGAIICHAPMKDSLLVIDKDSIFVVPLLLEAKHHLKTSEGYLKFFNIDSITYAINLLDKRLYVLNEKTYKLSVLPETPGLFTKEYLRFYNENNLLWMAGTVSGVRILGGTHCQHVSEIMYPQHLISDIYKDKEGNILLSTFNNGVLVIPNLEIPDVLNLPEKQAIVSVQHDSEFGILMGSLDGQLVAYNDHQNHYKTISNSGNKPLQALYSWKNFPYIIFDDGQMKAYHKKTGKVIPLMQASLKDAVVMDSQTVYLALNIGICKITLTKFNSFTEEYIDSLQTRAYSIEIEPQTKNIFVATSDGLKMLKRNGKVENIIFKGHQVFANDLSSDGKTLYVSSPKNGILFFENGAVVRQFIPKVNQQEIEIHKLIVHNQKIYISSSKRFVVLDMDGSVITQLNMKHGFFTNKIFDFEIIGDQIWISHSKGVQKININYVKNNIEKPMIKISNLDVNDVAVKNLSSTAIYKSAQRKFRFTIGSPTLRNRENIKYHYKLVGYDDKWFTADYDNNQLSYNALGAGTYNFLVKAENQGVFSETIEYSFTILSPFYLRSWFIATEIVLFLLVVALIYRWQLNIQRKKSAQINELNASKLTAIQSQMNPHFIFNSLNSIQDLILKGDIENSYSYITTFANMVRSTLNYSEKDFIDIEQEIELLELYLSLEKLRFKKDLHYKINSENVADIMIPPLLIQPFIENALLHGLLPKKGLKELNISFKLEEMLICVIEDNGIGREKAKMIRQRKHATHKPFASNAIHRRFEILSSVFNGKFGYFYEDLYDGEQVVGTRVTLKIPVKQEF